MVDALLKEIEMRKNEISSPSTIYFGGGTPSVISIAELQQIFEALEKNFEISSVQEITLECNPDDISKEKLIAFKNLGINRLSIGVQSFFEEDLQFMHRAHNAKQAEECLQLSQAVDFENITIDLIYGSPTTTDERWLQNLNKLIEYKVPHFSAYALTVEPKTLLAHQIKTKKSLPISEEKQARQFKLLQNFAKENDYIQYEVSNFAQKNKEAIHNSSYWKGDAYVGFGPSAHSFDGKNIRCFNVANNTKYIQSIAQGKLPKEVEILTEEEQYNEWIMIGLRSIYGLSEEKLMRFNQNIQSYFRAQIAPYLNHAIIEKIGDKYFLSKEHFFQADGVASDLFWVA